MTARPTSFAFTVEGKKWANLNGSRGNHHAHQALMNDWKARAVAAIRAVTCSTCQMLDAPVRITATVRRTRNGRADAHNVTPTIKACIDAAVACGVIADDHDGIVSQLITQAGPKASAPTVEIRMECI